MTLREILDDWLGLLKRSNQDSFSQVSQRMLDLLQGEGSDTAIEDCLAGLKSKVEDDADIDCLQELKKIYNFLADKERIRQQLFFLHDRLSQISTADEIYNILPLAVDASDTSKKRWLGLLCHQDKTLCLPEFVRDALTEVFQRAENLAEKAAADKEGEDGSDDESVAESSLFAPGTAVQNKWRSEADKILEEMPRTVWHEFTEEECERILYPVGDSISGRLVASRHVYDSDLQKDLAIACEQGELSVVSALLAQGADINGWSKNSSRVVFEGEDFNPGEFKQFTPLFWAMKEKRYNIVRYLLSKGADTKLTDDRGKHLLFFAKDTLVLKIVFRHLACYSNYEAEIGQFLAKRTAKSRSFLSALLSEAGIADYDLVIMEKDEAFVQAMCRIADTVSPDEIKDAMGREAGKSFTRVVALRENFGESETDSQSALTFYGTPAASGHDLSSMFRAIFPSESPSQILARVLAVRDYDSTPPERRNLLAKQLMLEGYTLEERDSGTGHHPIALALIDQAPLHDFLFPSREITWFTWRERVLRLYQLTQEVDSDSASHQITEGDDLEASSSDALVSPHSRDLTLLPSERRDAFWLQTISEIMVLKPGCPWETLEWLQKELTSSLFEPLRETVRFLDGPGLQRGLEDIQQLLSWGKEPLLSWLVVMRSAVISDDEDEDEGTLIRLFLNTVKHQCEKLKDGWKKDRAKDFIDALQKASQAIKISIIRPLVEIYVRKVPLDQLPSSDQSDRVLALPSAITAYIDGYATVPHPARVLSASMQRKLAFTQEEKMLGGRQVRIFFTAAHHSQLTTAAVRALMVSPEFPYNIGLQGREAEAARGGNLKKAIEAVLTAQNTLALLEDIEGTMVSRP